MAEPQTTDPMVAAFSSMPATATDPAVSSTTAGQKSQTAAPHDPMEAAFGQIAQQGVDPKTAPPTAKPPSAGDRIMDVLKNEGKLGLDLAAPGNPDILQNPIVQGAGKAVGETAHTIGRAINAVTGDSIKWLPTSLEQPKSLEAQNDSEMLGKMGENVAEFVLGDEALKGVSIAEKLGIAQKINEFAQKSPTLAKLLNLGLNATRGAAAGAVTGELHGGTQGAEEGAVGGAAGEVAGAGIGAAAKGVKSLLFPSEEVGSQVVKDSIRKALGNKVDADVADEIAGRVKKESILSPMENELKLAKASLDEDLPKMNSALDETLANSTAKTGNAARVVNSTFDDAVKQVQSGVGTEKEAASSAINDVRKEVLGKLTNDPMTAQQVNDVKRLVGDQIKKFAPPENLSSIDAHKKEAYRQAYFSLRDIVSNLAPESKPLNQKISRAISAQDILEKKFPQLENSEQAKASYQGTKSTAAKGILKKGAIAAGIGGAGSAGIYAAKEALQ